MFFIIYKIAVIVVFITTKISMSVFNKFPTNLGFMIIQAAIIAYGFYNWNILSSMGCHIYMPYYYGILL